MTTTTAAPAVLIEVDPADLIVDGNVRTKLGDISALVASVRAHGVLIPVLVRPENGGYRLVAGQRRTAAAIKAGVRIQAVVRDVDGDQALLEAGLIENLGREDLPAADEARGFEQLAAFGLDVAAISALTTRAPDRVEQGLAVAASKPATATAERYQLTLEQAAAVAEFDGDRDAVKEITVQAKKDPRGLDHVVARLRATRDRRAKATALRAELADAKVSVVKDRPGYRVDGPCRLTELKGADGKALTAANHKGCPGHAAFVEDPAGQDPSVTWLCTAPKKNGHKPKWTDEQPVRVGEPTPADREKKSGQMREVRAGNVEWRAAEGVRLEFVRNLLARRRVPNGTLRFVAEEALGDPEGFGRTGNDGTLVDLLGRSGEANGKARAPGKAGEYAHARRVLLPEVRAAADARLPLLLLAQVAADREGSMGVHTWRPRPGGGASAARRWLDFLERCGYVQSDIEKRVP